MHAHPNGQYPITWHPPLSRKAILAISTPLPLPARRHPGVRYMHENKTLYRLIHSHHHKLVVPYAYGALYNQPLESLLLDALGAAVSLYATGAC